MACFIRLVVSAALVSAGLSGFGWMTDVRAAPASNAPPELRSAIAGIEAAANAQNIQQVMAFYSSTFSGPDGFTREQYQSTLNEFWSQYSNLTYEVELLAWEAEGNVLIAETLTTISGTQSTFGREMELTAEMRSRQRFDGGLIVAQEILAEEAQLSSGPMPPSVRIQLPQSVIPGQQFNFDAIVQEPLGNRLLLGLAVDEGVTSEDFLTPRPVNLGTLSAGGLFKVGKAPQQPDQRWISSVLIRDDGIVIDTRRLTVEN